MNRQIITPFLIISSLLLATVGCAKGPLWRTGYLSPWARKTWAEEEQIAESLPARKANLTQMVESAVQAGPDEQETASQQIAETLRREPIILVRAHAAGLLGQLESPSAESALRLAAEDPNSEVRLAAVNACREKADEAAMTVLAEVSSQDADIDVKLAGIRALGQFKRDEFADKSAIIALGRSLDDGDPAVQTRAMESLARVTGQRLDSNTDRWRDYLKQNGAYGNGRLAAEPDDSIKR